MKTVNTKEFLDTLCELAENGETVSTVVSGGSMLPFLSGNRDFVFLQKPQRPVKRGDIVLFTRENGDYVLHRVRHIKAEGYYLIGDRQTTLEGPVEEGHIRCIAVKVRRKGKILTEKNFCWKFFSTIWLHAIPFRSSAFAIIGFFHRIFKR